jgi:hypothetical protein
VSEKKTSKPSYPSIEDVPDDLFGKQRFRRLTFREHMLEEYPAFRERLLEAFATEDGNVPPLKVLQ